MIANSSARLVANFFTVARRFWSLFIRAIFAMTASVLERELEGSKKRTRLCVCLRCRCNRDVQTPEHIDLVVLDLRKYDLFLDAQIEIPASVEGTRGNTPEVADTRNRNGNQASQEFVHAAAAQGHHATDRVLLADLLTRDRLLRLSSHRLLAGDLDHVSHDVFEDLFIFDGSAPTHCQPI